MKNARSTRRIQLVGELLAHGSVFCPCCGAGMYMQGVESAASFQARHALLYGGETPGKAKRRDLTATVDHIVPQSRGGTGRWENLLVMCRGCNDEKAALSVPEWVALRRNGGRPFKKLTEGYLLALHIKARKSLGFKT